MKIAILGTRGIPSHYGGFETFAEQLATRLVERGHEVTVYCEAGDGDQLDSYHGVRLSYVASPHVSSLSTILFDLRCLWEARKSYDVIYMLGYGSAVFCFLPRIWGTEVWINMDGIEWARAKWGFAARAYFRAMEAIAMWTANCVIADAENIRRHLVRRHARLPKCHVIAYGSNVPRVEPDLEEISKWHLQPNEYYLVVARLEPENNVQEIIAGYRASGSRRTLVIVGNHLTQTAYVKQITSVAGEGVLFVGGIYDPAVLQSIRFYARAYLHGHSVGGTNPSLLEAMACRNLVIAHDNPFNREVLDDCGMFFSTPKELSTIIRMLEEDHDRFARIRDSALRRVTESYNWDRVADQYCECLHDPANLPAIEVPESLGVEKRTNPVARP
jgi:glycosyltransferase involved in cell wall biosynthesis